MGFLPPRLHGLQSTGHLLMGLLDADDFTVKTDGQIDQLTLTWDYGGSDSDGGR